VNRFRILEKVCMQSSAIVSEDAARVTEPDTLYSGKAGLSHERWKFWKERLTEVREVVSEDVKPVAVAAVEKMTEIEAPKQ
jgi:hypothetical protein